MSRMFMRRMFSLKPTIPEEDLHQAYGLFDLLCVGVGGTIGSGVFVLVGQVTREYAGPSVILCWLVGGLASCLSGLSYMELATRWPDEGSVYAWSYHILGEVVAVASAFLLALEYGISGTAVARSWAGKVVTWLEGLGASNEAVDWMDYAHANLLAVLLQAVCAAVLIAGVKMGKWTVNGFSIAKVGVVLFLIFGGLPRFKSSNFAHGFPPQRREISYPEGDGTIGHKMAYGWTGVFGGITQIFFGYVGFDEVCCLAGETKNPGRTLPLAVIGTIGIVALLSIGASTSLVGMQPYYLVDPNSGFAKAFDYNDMSWAGQIASIGELLTLPVVVLVGFLAQPRLQYAMSQDGLAPPILAKLDKSGNLRWSILVAAVYCIIFALFVPFGKLADLTNAGVLLAFTIADICVIMLRYQKNDSKKAGGCLIGWCVFMFAAAAVISKAPDLSENGEHGGYDYILIALLICLGVMCAALLIITGKVELPEDTPEAAFIVPLVPYLPLVAIAVNVFLISQQSWASLGELAIYLFVAVMSWFAWGYLHSKWSSPGGIAQREADEQQHLLSDKYVGDNGDEDDEDIGSPLKIRDLPRTNPKKSHVQQQHDEVEIQ